MPNFNEVSIEHPYKTLQYKSKHSRSDDLKISFPVNKACKVKKVFKPSSKKPYLLIVPQTRSPKHKRVRKSKSRLKKRSKSVFSKNMNSRFQML